MNFVLTLLFLSTSILSAQIITSEPVYPTQNDSIIIYYDATEGDQGLMGYSGNDIYAHTGVITNYSTGSSDWKHVVAEWDENIPKANVIRIDTDYYRLAIGYPRDYYDMSDPDEEILQLAFVFRNGNGSVTGRDVDGADIFYDLYEPGINVLLLEPVIDESLGDYSLPAFTSADDTLTIKALSVALGTEIDSLNLYINNELVMTTSDDTLSYDFYSAGFEAGTYPCTVLGKDTLGLADTVSFNIAINPAIFDASRPVGTRDGINYENGTQVTLSLFAPYKNFVYVIGDFTDWRVSPDYFMKREVIDADSIHWWLTIDGLIPGEEYAYQYLVDGEIRIGDPYTEKVLDPWHDEEIIELGIYPGLKMYPEGKTKEPTAILQTNQSEFQWQYTDSLDLPEAHELVVYELLIRDFLEQHTYSNLIDTLDYLDNLGVNAIELMPINEFEGNSSWGYNPSFYFAPDKFYGPAEDLKRFIDECHRRDIVVLIDMVLNHSFGQSPLVRLYATEKGFPSGENPWYNPDLDPNSPRGDYIARHPYNVGYDFNHEKEATKSLVKRVNRFWLEEYNVDGFRFDLTKGFTQRNTFTGRYDGNGNAIYNEGQTSAYDVGRIATLKRIADEIWQTNPNAYVIIEHFADNEEEIALSDYNLMSWGNMNYNYNEATMGWNESGKSDFSGGYYRIRGWDNPTLVTFMESHDEERLMFKNLEYGNSSDNYNIQDLEIALNRIKLAAAFFLTYPGPKMIWHFGELGYDVSIDDPCRVCEKPILWEYFDDEWRNKLYKTYATLIKLRRSEPVFHDPAVNAELNLSTAMKRIRSSHSSMSAIIVGNFGVTEDSIIPGFFHSGTWYDFFSGVQFQVNDVNEEIMLEPGEFHIFTNQPLPMPEDDILNALESDPGVVHTFRLSQNYPNPFNPVTTIGFELARSSQVQIRVYDILGREVRELVNSKLAAGPYEAIWNGKNQNGISVGSGVFIYEIQAQSAGEMVFRQSRKMVLIR
jgi:1,4-alpha-glucan branching enzyme